MLYILLCLCAISGYLLASIVQFLFLTAKLRGKQTIVFYFVILAILSHAWLLYHWIDTTLGQNLSLFNLFSQAAWLVALLHLILALRKPIENMGIFVYPISALSIILALLFPGSNLVDTSSDPIGLIHFILAIATFSILCLAACQALLIAIQDWQLRHKDTTHALRILPPMENMERILFQLISIGFILLSILAGSSFYFFANIFAAPLLSKTILTFLAWGVFAILLLGRVLFGLRSKTAVRWTLGGVVLLLICYLVSRIVA